MSKAKFHMPTPEEDAAINAAALADPDAQPLSAEQLAAMVPARSLRGRPRSLSPKEHINIRLSPDVLEAFRATGAGWQTRVDSALRDWLRTHSPQ